MPSTVGLFHRAVMQSSLGGALCVSMEQSTLLTEEVLRELAVRDVKAIHDAPVDRLVEVELLLGSRHARRAAARSDGAVRPCFVGNYIFSPTIDDVNLCDPRKSSAALVDVPLLIGTTADETLFASCERGDMGKESLVGELTSILGRYAGQIVSEYRGIRHNPAARELLIAITTDQQV